MCIASILQGFFAWTAGLISTCPHVSSVRVCSLNRPHRRVLWLGARPLGCRSALVKAMSKRPPTKTPPKQKRVTMNQLLVSIKKRSKRLATDQVSSTPTVPENAPGLARARAWAAALSASDAVFDLGAYCPECVIPMVREHAHYRCYRCWYRDSCCF